MKWITLLAMACLCVSAAAEQPPADELLAFVRSKLPDRPLRLTGALKVQTRNGFTKSNLPVTIDLDWGAATPRATYAIENETLVITWQDDVPQYDFSNTQNTPTSDILDTGITWADLSFSVLWWPGSKIAGEDRKINRDCYIVDVPIPDSEQTMRLWIEKKMGMLLEAQTLDKEGKRLRRLKIKSIKKMDGMWVAKNLELKDEKSGSKTTLQISGLEWTATNADA
jgi:hypothetical protein